MKPPSGIPAGRFFGLVFALSVPFWIAGFILNGFSDHLPIDLPVSALMTFVPGAAAIILIRRDLGGESVRQFLRAASRVSRPGTGRWYAIAFVFAPVALFLTYLVLLVSGMPLPETHLPLDVVPVFFVMFLVGAIGEELGWQAYAYGPLRARWNAFQTALVLGLVWTAWHVIPYFQTDHSLWWIGWHCLVTVLLRVVTVWIFVNAGNNVPSAVLFHAMCNVGFFLFPNYGTHYDPMVFALVLAIAVAAILFLWGPGTLARYRFSERAPRLPWDLRGRKGKPDNRPPK